MNKKTLKDKKVVILAWTSGFGFATARAAADAELRSSSHHGARPMLIRRLPSCQPG